MNEAYLEAKKQLAFDPPTHMAPHEWRRLVEGLVRQIEQDRANLLQSVAFKLEERVQLLRRNGDTARVTGVEDAIELLRWIAENA
jgi:hypothetical protein